VTDRDERRAISWHHHQDGGGREYHRRKGGKSTNSGRSYRGGQGQRIFVDIQEVHKPELDAQLVSESIALQLESASASAGDAQAVDSALASGARESRFA